MQEMKIIISSCCFGVAAGVAACYNGASNRIDPVWLFYICSCVCVCICACICSRLWIKWRSVPCARPKHTKKLGILMWGLQHNGGATKPHQTQNSSVKEQNIISHIFAIGMWKSGLGTGGGYRWREGRGKGSEWEVRHIFYFIWVAANGTIPCWSIISRAMHRIFVLPNDIVAYSARTRKWPFWNIFVRLFAIFRLFFLFFLENMLNAFVCWTRPFIRRKYRNFFFRP